MVKILHSFFIAVSAGLILITATAGYGQPAGTMLQNQKPTSAVSNQATVSIEREMTSKYQTNELKLLDYINDTDELVVFSKTGLEMWNPPTEWTSAANKTNGQIVIFPKTNSIQESFFKGTTMRLGQLPFENHLPASNPVSFFSEVTSVPPAALKITRTRTLTTKEGLKADVTYFARYNLPIGALAVIHHNDFCHYFALSGTNLVASSGATAFATFHRYVYRYQYIENIWRCRR